MHGIQQVDVQDLYQKINDNTDIIILDIRPKEQYDQEKIISAINIPFNELEERKNELDQTTPIYLMCNTGTQTLNAYALLQHYKYNNVFHVRGGMQSWKEQNYKIN
jgi:rhodanese-related sulfurtransferase